MGNDSPCEFAGGLEPVGRLGGILAGSLTMAAAALGTWQMILGKWMAGAIALVLALGLLGMTKGLKSGTTVRGDAETLSVGFRGGPLRSIAVTTLVEVYIGAGVDADEVRLETEQGDVFEFSLSMMDVRTMPRFIEYLARTSSCSIRADKRFLELVPPSRRSGVRSTS